MHRNQHPIHGRGTATASPNRFTSLHTEPDEEWNEEAPLPQTTFVRDTSASIIATNTSPDIPFDASINPYRGCEHGCIYCYARPTHEYLGFSAGIDFESTIVVKHDAAALLRKKLNAPSWKPQAISMSGVTDPYQPAERRYNITRSIVEVLAEFRNPITIITKNHLVTRDLDLLTELAAFHAVGVFISITSLDPAITAVMEPRTSRPHRRLAAVEALSKAGIPVGVMVAPVIPGLTDHEMQSIVEAAARCGAQWAAFTPIRLPLAVAPLFEEWLEHHFPNKKNKILNRIRSLREGKLNNGEFGKRITGTGNFAATYKQMFHHACQRAGLNQKKFQLSTASFRRVQEGQLPLW